MTHYGPSSADDPAPNTPAYSPPPVTSQHADGEAAAPAATAGTTSRPRWLIPAAAVAAAAVLFGLGFVVGKSSQSNGEGSSGGIAEDLAAGGPTILVQAVTACGLGVSNAGISIGDDGYSLSLDGEGQESSGLSSQDSDCILNELEVSDANLERMGNTRALDGTQTAEQGNLSLSWTYHPDNGFDLVIQLAQP